MSPVLILALLPLTGEYEDLGLRLLKALETAFQRDALWTRRARLLVQDTRGDPDTAEMLCRARMAESGVVAVFGPLLTEEAQRCAPWAETWRIPSIYFSAEEGLAGRGDFVFQFALTRAAQVESLAQYASEQRIKRIGIFYSDDEFGRNMANRFWDALSRLPPSASPRVTVVETFTPGKADYQAEIKKIVGLDPLAVEDRLRRFDAAQAMKLSQEDFSTLEAGEELDPEAAPRRRLTESDLKPVVEFEALFIPGIFDSVGLLIPQLALFDVAVPLLGNSGWNHPQFTALAGDSAGRTVFVDGYWPENPDPANQALVQAFRKAKMDSPGMLEAQAYDAMRLVMDALSPMAEPDGRDVAEALAGVKDYPGITGPISIDATGFFHRPPLRLTVRKSKIEPLGAAAPASSPP